MLGEKPALVVSQLVLLEQNPERARHAARDLLGFFTGMRAYADNLRRMGFSDEELERAADRLVDGVVAWGDLDAIARRVREHLQAGADQVVLNVLGGPGSYPVEQWRQLAALHGS